MLKMTAACTLLLILAAVAPALGEDQMLATGFIWPVLMDGVSDPRMNTVKLKVVPGMPCVGGFWSSLGNDFGNRHCTHGLPNCGPSNCYHPGEDWNACPLGTNEAGEIVYAVANGKVVRTRSLGGTSGDYVTIEHRLVQVESPEPYLVEGTTLGEPTTFGVVYSNYLHLYDVLVEDEEVVTKGQAIARIANIPTGPHLHFEMTWSPMTSASNCYCGYCTSPQQLTDVKYIRPTSFIDDHLIDLSAVPVGSRGEGRLAILGPAGAFGVGQGTISARKCSADTASCVLSPQITSWGSDRITIDLRENVKEPVVVEIRRQGGQLVGKLIYPFNDVEPETWYDEVTTKAWQAGLIKGKGQSFFAPNVQITRAEFIEMLAKVSGATCGGSCVAPPFSDVAQGDWFYDSVRLAYSLGWVTNAATFRPHDLIARAEAAAVLMRATACAEILYPIESPYADVTDDSLWFYDAVYQARELGLMTGYMKGLRCTGEPAEPEQRYFCPSQAITRAEALKPMFSWFVD